MKIVKVKKDFYPLEWPNEIMGQYFHYKDENKNKRKTKSFQILDESLPDRWSQISWFDICIINEMYGELVALEYAECKVAGIVAGIYLRGYYATYQKIKHLIPEDFKVQFFDQVLRPDYKLACFGMYSVDHENVDKVLAERYEGYSPFHATYNGNPCSTKELVEMKFGKVYADILMAAI